MTHFYISADLEGVCGVVSPLQCYPKSDLSGYQWAVRQLAHELSILTQAILAQDPHCTLVVNDAHSTMTNLLLEQLPPSVKLLSGKPKKCAMVTGLDSTYDAMLLVGYHAKAGTEKGVLNHTFHSKLADVRINGVSYGEGSINALYASLVHQVPTILASGDQAFCTEIKTLLPKILTVETKVGVSTTAALSTSPDSLIALYEDQATQMMRQKAKWDQDCPQLTGPYTLEIEFIDTLACDVVMTSPLYHRQNGRTVSKETSDFETLYRSLQSAYTMLAYTDYMT